MVKKTAGSEVTKSSCNILLGCKTNDGFAGSPFSQDLQMRDPQTPAPHHPRCVERSQKTSSNPRPQRPERLQETDRRGLTLVQYHSYFYHI